MAAKATKSAKRIKLRVNDELPPLNPETDDWPELIRYCNALARRAGLTKEESDTNVFLDALFKADRHAALVLYNEHKGRYSFVMSDGMREELLRQVSFHPPTQSSYPGGYLIALSGQRVHRLCD